MSFNEWKHQCRELLSSLTPKMIEEGSLRDLAMRRPSEFRVNILGYGLVGEKIHEYLASRCNDEIAEGIHSIKSYRRTVRKIRERERGEAHPEQSDTAMHRVQKGSMGGRIPSSITEFYFLQDLSRLGLTDYLLQAGAPNAMSDILIVTPRYGFDDIDITESALRKAEGTDLEALIHRNRASLAATFAHLDRYRGDVSMLIQKMDETRREVASQKKKIDSVIKKGMEEGMIVKRDTAAIPDHILGAKALGEFLNHIDYQGFILSIPNPADIFTYTLMVSSGLPPSRVLGIVHHDETRFKDEFIRRLSGRASVEEGGRLIPRYRFTEVHIPVFGQHSPQQRPNISQAYFSGVDNLTGKSFTREGIGYFGTNTEKIETETLEFVTKQYIKDFRLLRQGTAPETGDATLRAIQGIIMSSEKSDFHQRCCMYTLHHKTKHPIVDGIQVGLSYRGAYPLRAWKDLTYHEADGLKKGQDSLLYLIEGLEAQGIMPGFTPDEAMRREQAYTKMHQHRDHASENGQDTRMGGTKSPPEMNDSKTTYNIGKVGTIIKGDDANIKIYMK